MVVKKAVCIRCFINETYYFLCGPCLKAEAEEKLLLTPLEKPTGKGRHSYKWDQWC